LIDSCWAVTEMDDAAVLAQLAVTPR